MRILALVVVLSAAAMLAGSGNALAAVVGVETFDAGTNGFVANTISSTVVHIAAGGNPDGFIESRKDLTPPVFDIGALTERAEFTGDYAAAGISGASVDLNFLEGDFTDAWLRFRMDVVTNGWRHSLTNVFPEDVWNTYAVSFDPTWSDVEAAANGWLTDQDIDAGADPSPPFATVLASVGRPEVRIGGAPISTLVGIDNFRLLPFIPEPGTIALVVSGMAALSLLALRTRKR